MAQEQTKRGGGGGDEDDVVGTSAAGQERREKLAEETDDLALIYRKRQVLNRCHRTESLGEVYNLKHLWRDVTRTIIRARGLVFELTHEGCSSHVALELEILCWRPSKALIEYRLIDLDLGISSEFSVSSPGIFPS